MDRRLFLRNLGLAAVGTGIAYSFPSIIVPKNIMIPEFNEITFEKMQRAYQKACLGNIEPNVMVLHRTRYAELIELIEPQLRYNSSIYHNDAEYNGLRFRNAIVIPDDNADKNIIITDTAGGLRFITSHRREFKL